MGSAGVQPRFLPFSTGVRGSIAWSASRPGFGIGDSGLGIRKRTLAVGRWMLEVWVLGVGVWGSGVGSWEWELGVGSWTLRVGPDYPCPERNRSYPALPVSCWYR